MKLCLPADQVTGENIGSNATAYWAKLVQPCLDANTKWTTVFGNHGEPVQIRLLVIVIRNLLSCGPAPPSCTPTCWPLKLGLINNLLSFQSESLSYLQWYT